ncbi:bacterio-opsin activator domain-containing protein [Halobaculum rubrum]|uniref:bacterio-opsin activator domain-containing protein n=1 Tax=Halobaculum rubrum TaxID=2872158 RepID=UPI001CA3E395|nr:bacterio-opsin activator domain-containing protein [Halobaculum rubrum]QZX99109.1 PAS domain S-box protein [Halobaculum rubrum]
MTRSDTRKTRSDTRQNGHDERTDEASVAVLFAGDDLADGPTVADLSGEERFDVTRSGDFIEAADTVDEHTVDCVVTTVSEDGFDGIAFLESVRQEHTELPVVVVAESIDGELARRAVDADATALVPTNEPDAVEAVVDSVDSNVTTYDREAGTRMPISDLTVKAERRLKERALDEAPIGITISDATDPEEPMIYMNDSFEEITGYPPDEVIGANHRFLQGPETDPEKVAEVSEAIKEKQGIQTVLRNYTRDGSEFWNQISISPILDEHGDISHFVGFQMDVTERKQAQQELVAERESLDRVLDRVNGLVSDVTSALVRAESRDEVEQLITERLGTGGEYTAAWLGRYDETAGRVDITEQAGARTVETEMVDLDDDGDGVRTLRETIDRQAVHRLDDASDLLGVAGGGTCVLVPLTYRSTTYGVVGVLDEGNLLDSRERVVLESLGRSVGVSINDVLTKRTITTDTVLNIGVELSDDDLFLPDLAAELGARFDHEATIADEHGSEVVTVVSTDFDDTEALAEQAMRHEDVVSVEPLVETDDETVVQFRLSSSPLVEVLSEAGSRVTKLHADSRTLEVEFRVGTEQAARRVLDALRAEYDRVELVAYHEDEPQQTANGFREELRSQLTDRQLTALRKAHVSGYFEWPRRAEGKQLAESMDIVPSTYHQHLQAAKRKLVDAFFER